MNQSVITSETLPEIISRAEEIMSRELTEMEKLLIELTLDQVRLGLAGYGK